MTQTLRNSAISNATTEAAITSDKGGSSLLPSSYVSLSTIQRNYEALKKLASDAETAAVVKADCYGHGMEQVAPALREVGCSTFFVAYLHEGIALRKLFGTEPEIIVFNGIQPEEIDTFKASDLTPVCNRTEEVDFLLSTGFSGRYAIHFDTGMNRLGVRPDDYSKVASKVEGTPPTLIMSHLACADVPDHPLNKTQLERFSSVAKQLPAARKSLSATAGMYLGPDYHFDLTRPGIGLYGGGPARPPGLKLKTAMTLTAPILSIFNVEAGEGIGYGSSFIPKSKTTIATVALGYADGYLRSGGNFGFGVLDGMPCPIVGRISMDLITVDITDLSDRPKIGDRIEFIGTQAGYEIQAEALGTLGYELTSRLGGRISRSWGE